jgi:hypothetical protein
MEIQTKGRLRASSRGQTSSAAAYRGKRLSAAMVANGWTFNCQVAYDLRVTESALSRWRSGGPMSVANAVALARHLGTSIHWLVMGREWVDQAPSPFPARMAELANLFSLLSPNDRQIVLALNRAIVESQSGAAAPIPPRSWTGRQPQPETDGIGL